MSVTLQLRGGTYSEHTNFTGAERELTVNTTDWTLVVHDGAGNQYPVTGARGVQGIQGPQGNQGDIGNPGLSVYNVMIYNRSASVPSTPAGGSFDFSTLSVVPPSGGWSNTIPTGSDPLYISLAIASVEGSSGTDSSLTWTSPIILAQNGAPGANTAGSAYDIWAAIGNQGTEADFLDSLVGAKGDSGDIGPDGKSAYELWVDDGNTGSQSDFLNSLNAQNGISVYKPLIYIRSSSAPTTPTGGSYDFTNLSLSAPSGGWTENIPLGSDPIYVSSSTASIEGSSGTD